MASNKNPWDIYQQYYRGARDADRTYQTWGESRWDNYLKSTNIRERNNAYKQDDSLSAYAQEFEKRKQDLSGVDWNTISREDLMSLSEKTNWQDVYRKEKQKQQEEHPQSFWETLLGVSASNTSMPQSALPGMTDQSAAREIVGAGLEQAAAGYSNLAGTVLEGLGKINDHAFDANHRQQKTAAENSLKYWQSRLENAETEEDRSFAEKQISIAKNALSSLEELKESNTRDVDTAAQDVYDFADRRAASGAELTEQAKSRTRNAGMGAVGDLLVDAGVSGVQMLGDAAANAIVPGSGLVSMGARSFGSGAQEARQAGASFGQQLAYGAGSAAVEVGTEKMFGVFEGVYGKGWLDNTKLAKSLTGAVQKMQLSPVGRTALSLLTNFGEEATEELVSGALNPALKSIYNGKGIGENYSEMEASDLIHDALVGGILGLVGGTNQIVRNAEQTKTMGEQYGADSAALVQEALEIDPENKTAQEARKRLEHGERLKDSTIRRIVEESERLAKTERAEMDKAAKEIEKEFGTEAADSFREGKPDGVSVASYRDAFKEAYQYGRDTAAGDKEAGLSATKEALKDSDVPAEAVENAYEAGRTQEQRAVPMRSRSYVDMDSVESRFGKAGAEVYQMSRPGNVDANVFDSAFNTAYQYGTAGATEEQAVRAVRGNIPVTSIHAAYTVGREQAAFRMQQQRIKLDAAKVSTRRGPGTVTFDGVNTAGLTGTQKAQIQVIRGISKVTGINVRMVENADFKGANGSYDPNTNTITIDVNAGRYSADDINDVVMGKTMSHELTHFIQHNNPEAYEELKKFVSQHLIEKGMSLDLLADEKITNSKGELTPDQAIDEVVADACEDMLKNTEAIDTLAKENWGLFKRIRNWLRNFHNALRRAFSGNGYVHEEAKAMLDKAAELQKIWDDAFVRAVQNYQQTADGRDAVEMTGKNGETVAVNDGNGHVQTSMRTYREGGREQLRTYLEQRVKDNAITRQEADDMISQMDEMYDLCKTFADQYALFGQWSEAEVRVDPKTGSPIFSVVKANGEYAMNLDFSLVCKKRRTLDAVFEQMINDGIMEDFEMKEASIAAINDIIRDHGFETACALCFVDSKRYRQGIVADAFVGMYNELVRSMIKDGQHADAFNFGGNSLIVNDGKGIDTLKDSDLDFTRINEVLKTEGKKTVLYKIAKDLKENPADRKLLMRGDFMSAKAFDTVKETNQRIMGLYNAKKGAGGPKASSLDVQYLNEIIGQKKFNAEKAYSVGGVRIQSFSDYLPRLVFDYMQMIADLHAKNLPAHAYTKEPLFILQFGLTGIKGNMSLVPEVIDGGVAPGLDKDGNYAWRDGQSFGSTVYGGSKAFIQKCYEIIGKKYSGQDRLTAAEGYELAKAIQNAPGYGVNCGTIAVGVSDEHIRKMLRDPDIRMVIPYHKSSLNHIVAVMTNIDRYHDYTGVQNTRRADGTKLTKRQKDFNYNEALQRLGDAKAAADEYLAWCDKKGYLPKFDQFRDEDGYYKLLEDFSTYDMNGEAAPQGGVTLTLPGEDSAFGSMAELMRMGLEEDALLQGKQDAAVPDIVAEIKKTLPGIEAKQRVQKSERITAERDAEYLELVGKYENETGYQKSYTEDYLDRLVAAAAKEHGYTTPKIYHGTRSFGFTVFDTSGTKPYAQKGYIYASTKRQVAANYAGDNHYAGVRPIGTKYDGGSSAESIIKDAKSVYSTTYRKPTKEDIDNRIRKDYAEAQKVREKLNELWSPLDNIPQEVANAVDWMTDIINTTVDNDLAWQVGADGIINGTNEEKVDLQKQLQHDFGRLEADRALVRDYYGEHRSEMNDDQKKYFRYLMSYEFGDALIDIQYGLCQVLTPDNLLINGDSFADMANLREAMDEVHNIGAYQLYGDLGDKPFIFDANGAQFWALKVPEVSDGYTDTDTVCKWAKAHGYTSVVMKNIYDYGDKADNYVFFNSEQVKSADPVTYDDKGNVIPLSKRFDTGKSDIRYSSRDVGERDAEYLEQRISQLESELSGISEQLEWMDFDDPEYKQINNRMAKLRNELDGLIEQERKATVRTPMSVILNNLDSYRRSDLISIGNQLTNSAWDGLEELSTDDIKQGIREIIDERGYSPLEMQAAKLGVYVRPVRQYSLRSPTDISSRELLANALESVAQNEAERDILKNYQAKVEKLSDIQQKLNEQRALMRDHINGTHKLTTDEMMKARNRAKIYADQLDRADKALLKLEGMGPVKAMLDREHKAFRKAVEANERSQAQLARYNERMQKRIEDARQSMENYRQRRHETEDRRKYKGRINRIANDFRQMILHPTDTRYAPTDLMAGCYQVALMLDTSGEREDTKSKAKFREQMQRIENQYNALKDSHDSDYAMEYDQDFAYMVGQLRQRLDGKAIRDLSVAELEDVSNVLNDIYQMLRQAKYQIGKDEQVTNYSMGERIVRQQTEYNARQRNAGTRALAGVNRVAGNVMRNVRRMTDYDGDAAISQLMDDINRGIRKKNRFAMEAEKLFDKFSGKRLRESNTKLNTYTLGGEEVQMTEQQAMQVILTWEREAVNGITRHMTGGGILLPNQAEMKKGHGTEAIRTGQNVYGITQEEVQGVYDTLDEWARDYMDTARDFFNGMAKDAINEATMQTKHRRMATTEAYIPFEIDSNTVAQEIEGVKFDATIEGMGMLKSVQEGAGNALIMRGLNTIVQRHIDKVGQVYGLAAPIKNFNKAMGVKMMGSSRVASAALNSADLKVLEDAVRDLQTPRQRARNAITNAMDKLQGAFVKATLLSNISVTIKQAASYSTAGLYLSQKALAPYQTTVAALFAANNSKMAKDLFGEIDEHTAAHYIRRKGMSLQEAATVAQDNGPVTRWMDEHIKADALNPLKWIQNMDVATTAALWLATKKQVELDGMTEADAGYWDKVTELYEKVIEDTQPNYDVLHRPEMQRTTDSLVKSILMFKTQPLQNAGIIWDAVGNYAAARRTGKGVAEARKTLTRAVGSQVASLAVFAAMSFLAYAAKNRLGRYKDDEEELTVESVMKVILKDMVSNSANLVMPVFGDAAFNAVDNVAKKARGETTYDVLSVPAVDMVNDWLKDVNSLVGHLSDLDSGKDKIPTDLRVVSMDVAALFGIPAENVYNIIRGTVGNVTDSIGMPLDWATDEEHTTKGMKAAWNSGHFDAAKEKLDALIAEKVANGKTEKEAKSALRSVMTTEFKPQYLAAYRKGDKAEMERIRKILSMCKLYDDLSKTIGDWIKKSEG